MVFRVDVACGGETVVQRDFRERYFLDVMLEPVTVFGIVGFQ
jgi:hypothetical protein